MDGRPIATVLRELGSSNPTGAWSEFLQSYAGLILQVVRLFEHDPDDVSSCFLFVCEQLSRRRFKRLRKFRTDGPAKFETWLRAVVRNLCLDWHRREYGRARPFRSIVRLRPAEQEVFRFVYEQGFSPEYALASLAPKFPQLNHQSLLECMERIEAALTPRQRWLLSVRNNRKNVQAQVDEEGTALPVLDPTPTPELQWAEREEKAALRAALHKLSPPERLMIRLRFENELTLEQVAHMMRLPDAQTADRRIRQILDRLRASMK